MPGARPRTYQITVEGELARSMDLALDGMDVERMDGLTTITAHVGDQMQLYSVLGRLGDLALWLLEVSLVDGHRPSNFATDANASKGGPA